MSADAHIVFDTLYAAHRGTLYAYLLGRTGDSELALDLAQDVFVRAWRNLATLESLPVERQRAWLLAVARNLGVDHYRSQATRRATADALERQAAIERTAAPSAELEVHERHRLERLDAAICALPEELRVVLVLQVVDERTSTEIGELLGKPAGTVRYQLAQARRRLARDIEP
ncbi:MAG: RNA polymerase sigma factor [Chloroflexi bacterium]|nr:RNA polymerase sigma factor [Chloroflexota bacterium]